MKQKIEPVFGKVLHVVSNEEETMKVSDAYRRDPEISGESEMDERLGSFLEMQLI